MLKKTLSMLAISALLVSPMANAGKVTKALGVTGIVVGGVVAYKMAKKLNVGTVTQNLANHIDNAPKTLDNNPEHIPVVIKDLNTILNDPNTPIEELPKYVVLDNLMRSNYGGGTVITSPDRRAVISKINNGEVKFPVADNSGGKNTTIKGGTLMSDEMVLEKNLVAAGNGSKPNGYKAFHIVDPKRADMAEARNVLKSVGMNINSAENGLFLPTGNTVASGIVHTSSLEGNTSYANYVNHVLMANKGNLNGVNSVLGDIYLKLSSGQSNF